MINARAEIGKYWWEKSGNLMNIPGTTTGVLELDYEWGARPQYATLKFSTKSKARNKTYPGLISMLQGFQICIA